MNGKSKGLKKQDVFIPEKYRERSHMRRRECSHASGLAVSTFDRLAWKGEGPPFLKTSPRGPALYPVPEFFDWLNSLSSK